MRTVVLILEDERSVLEGMEGILQPPSYSVYRASFGAEALEILKNNKIDILVMDIRMPEMGGLNFIHKAVELQNAMQFIVMCEEEERLIAIEAMSLYPVDYILKPIMWKEIQINIERCVERTRLNEELKIVTTNIKWSERASERALFSRITINALLETSLEPLSMEKQIDVILEIILTVPWLSIIKQGAIFFLDNNSGELRLVGQKNLPKPLLEMCAKVPLGHCLCGKAGELRETIFTNRVGDDHVVRFDGMEDHGHYCIPITTKGRLLGVLTLYVPAGYQRSKEEDAFIATLVNTLAIIIEHRQTAEELKEAEKKLRHLAYHDPLTGLRNRQSFDSKMNKIFSMMQASNRREGGRPLQQAFLAVLDIDHFKKVNDTYGHMMGDEVLVLFARHMGECFREKDAVFRFGGEEFVVLIVDTSLEAAETVLNRFRQTIETYDFPQVGQVTVSIGAVTIDTSELASNLIEKADKALYYSKSNGRNQAHFFQSLVDSGKIEDVERTSEEIDLW